jgi:hypothetical protein
MRKYKMTEEEIQKVDGNEELATSTPNALTLVNADDLNQESLTLINQIIAEKDIEKTKDLTHLFNINQNKKTMIRIDKLSGLQDNLVDQFVRRIEERPDEISNKELMDGIKIVQDIIERGQKQVESVEQTPLIQFNQQNNSVNIGDGGAQLNKESRDRVKNAVLALLGGLNKQAPTEEITEIQPTIVNVTENVDMGDDADD